MSAYLSFEWLKLSKRWMPRVILALVLALLIIFFWGQSTRLEDRPDLVLPRGWLTAMIFFSFAAPFFWPVLGGSWAGNEYGWGTIRTILTRRPYRMEHVLAALAILLAGLLVAIVAAITLTLRRRPGLKVQDISKQVAVQAKDRTRIVKMDAEKRS